MKNSIKKLLPNYIINWHRNRKINQSEFLNKTPDEVFTEIYNTNYWSSDESISGAGSEMTQTEFLIKELNKLFIEMEIKSVLDIPCGDFNWMKKVDLSNIDYTGADIVKELIEKNIQEYNETENRKFKVLNLISDNLPKNDLVFVRDCLVHLSYKDINNAIQNIKASGSKYLLTTTFTDRRENHDITTGDWRAINLQKAPFNFSTPLLIINEKSTEANAKDKSMALWDISKL